MSSGNATTAETSPRSSAPVASAGELKFLTDTTSATAWLPRTLETNGPEPSR